MQCASIALRDVLQTHRLPTLSSVRRSSVRRGSALRRTTGTTPGTRTAISGCRIATVCGTIGSAIHCWALCATEVHAICAAAAALQFVDDACELGLQCLDTLDDDLVRVETADCFDVEEETGRDCFVVEGLVGVGRAAVEVDALLVLGPRQRLVLHPRSSSNAGDIPLLFRILLVPVVKMM